MLNIYFQFQDNWFGVLHHIAGEHEWLDGKCEHGPLVANEEGKTYLDKNSKAFEAIRKVVFDQRFLKSLHHYVTFRYKCRIPLGIIFCSSKICKFLLQYIKKILLFSEH